MEDRRRAGRRLTQVPKTDLEILWDMREEVAVLIERLDNHITEHDSEEKRSINRKTLFLTNVFMALTIVSNIVIHFLPVKGH